MQEKAAVERKGLAHLKRIRNYAAHWFALKCICSLSLISIFESETLRYSRMHGEVPNPSEKSSNSNSNLYGNSYCLRDSFGARYGFKLEIMIWSRRYIVKCHLTWQCYWLPRTRIPVWRNWVSLQFIHGLARLRKWTTHCTVHKSLSSMRFKSVNQGPRVLVRKWCGGAYFYSISKF